jgi:hypothetical protein
MSREAYFAENSLVSYFFEDDNIKTMNKQIYTNVKCVGTLDSRMKDPYGKEEYGGTQWFLRLWTHLVPDTTTAKRYKDKFLQDMHDILNLDKAHHFEVDIDYDENVTYHVVFYIKEILTELAGKYGMTLTQGLKTIHDSKLGLENMNFIHEAFDDPIEEREETEVTLQSTVHLSHLLMRLKNTV